MGMCVRLADDFGGRISVFQKGFFRNLVALAAAFPVFAAAWRRGEARIPRAAWTPLVLRSVFGTLGIFANFYALGHIHLGDAAMLNKMAPFATIVASWILLGERVGRLQALAVAGAFGGAMLVVKPGFAFGGSAFPASVGLAGGIFAGLAYTCVHALGRLGVSGSVIVFFFSAFSTVASIPFFAGSFAPMTSAQTLILLGAGAGAAVGQFGITAAYRFAQPREIASWDYSNVVFSAFLGMIVLGQFPDFWSWSGMVVIVAMGVMAAAGRRRPAVAVEEGRVAE